VSPSRPPREPLVLLALVAVALVGSGIHPYDRLTWWMEIAPILIFFPVLVVTAGRFRFTPLAYRLIFVHALILIVGGHYTYARVPLGEWAKGALHFQRNNYDRLGHFAQGFAPAILAREVLLRRSPLQRGKWLFFLVTTVCLAVSAAFELVEWAAATLYGASANAYLATQGDPWDTQWDMFFALVGAVTAQLALRRPHDMELESI
jgi:putative membrane protein